MLFLTGKHKSSIAVSIACCSVLLLILEGITGPNSVLHGHIKTHSRQ